MPLLPLHQQQLRHHQRGDQDEDHLGVHGLVTAVLGVHPRVFHPATTARGQLRGVQARQASRRARRAALEGGVRERRGTGAALPPRGERN